jgi:chromosome partitioning protein
MEQWLPLIGWLAQRRPLHIAPGTPGITSGGMSATSSLKLSPVAVPVAAAPVVSPVENPETDPATPPATPTIG